MGYIIGILLGIMILGIFYCIHNFDTEDYTPPTLIALILGLITSVFILFTIPSNMYKQGQIDALTNNIKYELKENPNKTKEWIEIKTK